MDGRGQGRKVTSESSGGGGGVSHVGVQGKSILGRGNHQGRGGSVPGVLENQPGGECGGCRQ